MLYLLINITVRCYLPDPRVATDQLRTRALRRHQPERMCRMHTHNAGHFTFSGRLPRSVAVVVKSLLEVCCSNASSPEWPSVPPVGRLRRAFLVRAGVTA